jgi:hypothetical protein
MRGSVVAASFAGILCSTTPLLADDIKPSWPIPSEIKWEAINE